MAVYIALQSKTAGEESRGTETCLRTLSVADAPLKKCKQLLLRLTKHCQSISMIESDVCRLDAANVDVLTNSVHRDLGREGH